MVAAAEEIAGTLRGKRVVEAGCSLRPFFGVEAALRGAQVDLVERNIDCEPVVRAYFSPDPQKALGDEQARLGGIVDRKRKNRDDTAGYTEAFQRWLDLTTFIAVEWPAICAALPRDPIGLSLHFGHPFQKVRLAAAPDVIFTGQVLETEAGMGFVDSIYKGLKPQGWFMGDTTFWPEEEGRFPKAFPTIASVKYALKSGGFAEERILVLRKRWEVKGDYGSFPGQCQIQHAFFAQK
jgi:hypothetical protein